MMTRLDGFGRKAKNSLGLLIDGHLFDDHLLIAVSRLHLPQHLA
jgi:hypothetical protein